MVIQVTDGGWSIYIIIIRVIRTIRVISVWYTDIVSVDRKIFL